MIAPTAMVADALGTAAFVLGPTRGRAFLEHCRETLDAGNIERAALLGLDALTDFRFYRRPQELPAAQWRQIFEALGLPPGLVVDASTRAPAAASGSMKTVAPDDDEPWATPLMRA